RIPVENSSSRKMLGRSQCNVQPFEFRFIPPIKFRNFFFFNAPSDQMIADAVRDEEMSNLALQLLYRLIIQMIVMVMGDKDRINRRHFVYNSKQIFTVAFRPYKGNR